MSFERVRQLAQGSRESTALVFRGEPFRDLVAARVEVFTKTEPKELQKQIVAAATLAMSAAVPPPCRLVSCFRASMYA